MEGKFAHGSATLAKTTVICCVFCFKVLVFSIVINLENKIFKMFSRFLKDLHCFSLQFPLLFH